MIDLKKFRDIVDAGGVLGMNAGVSVGQLQDLLNILDDAMQDSKRIDFIEKNAESLSNDGVLWEIMVKDDGGFWSTDERTARQVIDSAMLEKA